MEVIVQVMSIHVRYLGGKYKDRVILEDGDSVKALIRKVNIPEQEVGIITVNGRQADPDFVLNNGDKIQLFPPALGGG